MNGRQLRSLHDRLTPAQPAFKLESDVVDTGRSQRKLSGRAGFRFSVGGTDTRRLSQPGLRPAVSQSSTRVTRKGIK